MNIPTTSIIPIKDLKIDEKNPNKMSEKNYNALKEAIKKYGFIVPIITNNELLIADGEHRVKAAEELGMTNIPVIKLPISEVDRRILRQVMNKLKGSHDDLLDTEEYKFLKEEESLNQLFKFLPEQEKEISRILKRLENSHEEKEEYVTVGAYERAKNKTKIKTGEIYKLGQHRLMCGDSLKTEDVGTLNE